MVLHCPNCIVSFGLYFDLCIDVTPLASIFVAANTLGSDISKLVRSLTNDSIYNKVFFQTFQIRPVIDFYLYCFLAFCTGHPTVLWRQVNALIVTKWSIANNSLCVQKGQL